MKSVIEVGKQMPDVMGESTWRLDDSPYQFIATISRPNEVVFERGLVAITVHCNNDNNVDSISVNPNTINVKVDEKTKLELVSESESIVQELVVGCNRPVALEVGSLWRVNEGVELFKFEGKDYFHQVNGHSDLELKWDSGTLKSFRRRDYVPLGFDKLTSYGQGNKLVQIKKSGFLKELVVIEVGKVAPEHKSGSMWRFSEDGDIWTWVNDKKFSNHLKTKILQLNLLGNGVVSKIEVRNYESGVMAETKVYQNKEKLLFVGDSKPDEVGSLSSSPPLSSSSSSSSSSQPQNSQPTTPLTPLVIKKGSHPLPDFVPNSRWRLWTGGVVVFRKYFGTSIDPVTNEQLNDYLFTNPNGNIWCKVSYGVDLNGGHCARICVSDGKPVDWLKTPDDFQLTEIPGDIQIGYPLQAIQKGSKWLLNGRPGFTVTSTEGWGPVPCGPYFRHETFESDCYGKIHVVVRRSMTVEVIEQDEKQIGKEKLPMKVCFMTLVKDDGCDGKEEPVKKGKRCDPPVEEDVVEIAKPSAAKKSKLLLTREMASDVLKKWDEKEKARDKERRLQLIEKGKSAIAELLEGKSYGSPLTDACRTVKILLEEGLIEPNTIEAGETNDFIRFVK
jgi:acyl-CoA hydrolase